MKNPKSKFELKGILELRKAQRNSKVFLVLQLLMFNLDLSPEINHNLSLYQAN